MTTSVPDGGAGQAPARALRARLALALIRESPSRVTLVTEGGGSWWNSGPCIGGEDAPGGDPAAAEPGGEDS